MHSARLDAPASSNRSFWGAVPVLVAWYSDHYDRTGTSLGAPAWSLNLAWSTDKFGVTLTPGCVEQDAQTYYSHLARLRA